MRMRILIYIGFLAVFAAACSSSRMVQADKPTSANVVKAQSEGDEYELSILDTGFTRWFATYGKPVNFHAPAHYEQWNRRYVVQWNQLVDRQGFNRRLDYPFQNRIDYQANIDYGVKFNHELYWYFRYIESLYGGHYDFGFGRGNRIM